jgi:glycine cleavage system pyridoxal-binding protein P
MEHGIEVTYHLDITSLTLLTPPSNHQASIATAAGTLDWHYLK